ARKAVELAPGQLAYHNTLGIALYRNDRFREGVTELEKCLAANHSPAADLFFLAMCHHRLDDAGKAKDCRERAGRRFEEQRGQFRPEQIEELAQFQTEADAVLSQPPVDK